AREAGLARFVQPQVAGEERPDADRQIAHERLLDPAEPAGASSQQPAREAIGERKVDRLVLQHPIERPSHDHRISDPMSALIIWATAALAALCVVRVMQRRLLLSRAKHRSLQGHARIAKALARWVPAYHFDSGRFFDSDGSPRPIADRRQRGFEALAARLDARAP